MCVVCAGQHPRAEHSIPSKVSAGGPDRREGEGQRDGYILCKQTDGRTDGRTGAAEQSRPPPCLLCLEKNSSNGDSTRLWSRVIGGAGWCPACSKSRLPHHRFSPNLPRGVGCNPRPAGIQSIQQSLGAVLRPMGPGTGRLVDGEPEARLKSSQVPAHRVKSGEQGTGDKGQGKDKGQSVAGDSASLCYLTQVDCVRVAMLWRRVQTAQASQRQIPFQVEHRLDNSRPQYAHLKPAAPPAYTTLTDIATP